MQRGAGIVLAGGRSSRMGRPKAWLEWHGSTLLRRVVSVVARGSGGPVVVVRAPGQDLPALPPGTQIVEDEREGRGPLQGIAAGLRALQGRADAAYVSSVDVPLLHPAFVARVLAALEDDEIDVALPVADGHNHPLAAAYRVSLLGAVEGLLAADRLRPAFLFDAVRVRRLEEEELRPVDADLASVLNLNAPADYDAARARRAPEVTVQRFGALRRGGPREAVPVYAATLGTAAAAAGVALDGHVVAALNGDQISRDPEMPLASGDSVAFMAADAGG
ncbi:MAG: molybdenum cofactor guanylyltransferase [Solirubrobacterales bacterium]|nr:molybdenum cofactor guanylyltransferase [Solirubrobacterales bacterium]